MTTPSKQPTEERQGSEAGLDDSVEGFLQRKHEWESTTKKASNRSWEKLYSVLRPGAVLSFYKDSKTARATPDVTHRNEAPLTLANATVEVAADYTKKKHVFRLKLAQGGEYLFQAKDDEEMNTWVVRIQAALNSLEEGAGPARAQTLPAPPASKDEPKKRGFFTLKKK